MKLFSRIKLKLFAFLITCFLIFGTTPAYADVTGALISGTPFGSFLAAIGPLVGTSLQKFVLNTLTYTVSGGVVIVGGCGNDPKCPPEYKGGATGAVGDMVAGLYSAPPASGVQYVADSLRNFGLVESARAQTGTGFTALTPLQPLWRAFRNLTYILFVLIFVVTGLAIMFRYKLNPQTVITIQSALPRVVVALILVTFSYAIAGLMIDLLYVIISLGAFTLTGIGNNAYTGDQLQVRFTEGGFGDTVITLYGLVTGTTSFFAAGIGAIGGALGAIIPALLVGGFAALPALGTIGVAAGIGALLMLLILLLIILYVLIRLFLGLLQSYIAIIFLVVFAPIQIALGVIPGIGGFGTWLRNLSGHLAVFAAVAFILMLGSVLVRAGVDTANLWRPPVLIGGAGGVVANNIGAIIALGILFIIHQVPQAVRNAFGIRGLGFNPLEATGARQPLTDISGSVTRYRLGSFFDAPATTIKPGSPLSHVPKGWWPILSGVAKARGWYRP